MQIGKENNRKLRKVQKKQCYPKQQNAGITLIALVVTLVVLLILAGISITVLFGDSGIMKTAQEAGNKWKEAAQKEQTELQNLENELNKLIDESKVTGWAQNKTVVTNGTVTLEVGQAVSGYTANGVGDGNWYVLGAKDGKLLITTNSNQGIFIFEGQEDYINGVNKLNTEGAKFNDGNMAELARSINIEDVNRVTGYDPDVAKYNEGTNVIAQWNNKVTYTLNADGKIHYQGTKYPTTDTTSSQTNFTYWNGSNWITLGDESGEYSVTLTHNCYSYYPQILSATESTEATINGSSKAYTLLFAGTDSDYYWLSSQVVVTDVGVCSFGMFRVAVGRVGVSTMYYSNGSPNRTRRGLRPVVSLKSNVKVTESGALSI